MANEMTSSIVEMSVEIIFPAWAEVQKNFDRRLSLARNVYA